MRGGAGLSVGLRRFLFDLKLLGSMFHVEHAGIAKWKGDGLQNR